MNHKPILIIGAGGHAAELRDYIRFINLHQGNEVLQVTGFIDDDKQSYDHYGYEEPFLGDIQGHAVRSDVDYLMGIANLAYRQKIIEKFKAAGANFTGLIHPTALISPSAEIGEGTVISHNASVGPKVRIGRFNMLNSRCTIGHDTVLGDYNFISPQVALSGNTTVGNNNLIGTNACTIPGMTIGDNNKIAAGMVIFKPVSNNETVRFRFTEKLIVKKED